LFYLTYWPDITIKNKGENIHIALDVAIPVDRQKFHAKRSRKETKIQRIMYRDTMNAEHETHNYTGKYCNHRSGNKGFKSHTIKIFNRFTTKDSYTYNIKHNTESTAA
jgi:heat shock protein HslJ